eukprot:1262126-Alexandrium_andersonii.AAC.1
MSERVGLQATPRTVPGAEDGGLGKSGVRPRAPGQNGPEQPLIGATGVLRAKECASSPPVEGAGAAEARATKLKPPEPGPGEEREGERESSTRAREQPGQVRQGAG